MSTREQDIEAALADIRGGHAQAPPEDMDSALAEIRRPKPRQPATTTRRRPAAAAPAPPREEPGLFRRFVNWVTGDEEPQEPTPAPDPARLVAMGQQMHDAGMALDPVGTQQADRRLMEAFARAQETPAQRLRRVDPRTLRMPSDATSTPRQREADRREAMRHGTPSTIGPDERSDVTRRLAEDRADRVEELRRRPSVVRKADAFLGEGAQALTFGYRDEIMGALAPGATAEDFERAAQEERDSRTTGDQVAGMAGTIAGVAVPIAGQNALLARAARFAPEGTALRAGLESFGHTGARTLAGDALRGAAEGVPYDLAYDYDQPGERPLNLMLGAAGGALAGAVFRVKPRGAGHAAEEVVEPAVRDAFTPSMPLPSEIDRAHEVLRERASWGHPSEWTDEQVAMEREAQGVLRREAHARQMDDLPDTDWLRDVEARGNAPGSPEPPGAAPSTPVEPRSPVTPAPSAQGGALDAARRIAEAGERPTAARVMREAGVSMEEARDAVRALREERAGGVAPAAAPAAEPEAMDAALAEVRGEPAPVAAQPAADLPEGMGNVGRGVVDGMYDTLWRQVQAGETMEAGAPSVVLQIAQRVRRAGGMQTPEELRALAQDVATARDRVAQGTPFQEAMGDVLRKHMPTPNGNGRPAVAAAAAEAAEAAPAAPAIPGPRGREATVSFPDGGKVRAVYRVVEADAVQPSHNPTSFQANPEYPAGVQGRDYHRDVAAQERIAEHTQGFDPERLLDPTGLVASGPPVVTPGGVAVAGNERTMLRQRIRELNPEAEAAYRQGLIDRASYYGIDPAEVEGMRHPMLVRELADDALDTSDPQVLRELNTRSDQEVGKVKDPLSDAATRARQMQGGQALQHFAGSFEPDQTLRDYLGSAHGRRFVQELVADGVIPRGELPRYVDVRTGALNQQGTAMVERALYLSAVPDPDIVDAVQPSLLQQLEPAIPHVVQAAQVPGWNVSPVLRDALGLFVEARGKGLKSVDDLLANTEMFGRQVAPGAEELARFLERANRKETRRFFEQYAEAARLAQRMGQSEDLFGAMPPDQADTFRRLLTDNRGVADMALVNLLARTGAGAAAGGAVGGSMDDEDPVRGALLGALAGAALGAGSSLPFRGDRDQAFAQLRARALALQDEIRARPRSPEGFVRTTADELAETPHPSELTRERTGFPLSMGRRPQVQPLDTSPLRRGLARVQDAVADAADRLQDRQASALAAQAVTAGRPLPHDVDVRRPGIGLRRADGAALDRMVYTVARTGAGAALGATQGDTPEERLTNAALFAGLGAAAPAIYRYLRGMDQIGAVGPRDPLGRAPFYSRLEQAIAGGQKAASGEQWLRYLDNRPEGIARGEREWTGIDEYLRSRSGQRVTREELAQYMAEHRIQVQEVVRGNVTVNPEADRWVRRLQPSYQRARDDLLARMYGTFGADNREWLLGQLDLGKTPEEIIQRTPHVADRLTEWAPEIERYRKYADALRQAQALANPEEGWRHANMVRYQAERDLHDALDDVGARNNDAAHNKPAVWAEEHLRRRPGPALLTPEKARAFDVLETALRRYREAFVAEKEADRAYQATRAKYSSFAVPGGEKYREVLLTLPSRSDSEGFQAWARQNNQDLFDLSNDSLDDLESAYARESGDYEGPHWNEPNVLAHIRMDDRTLPNGERVLFVHEIQSDWHQAGREVGYSGEVTRQQEDVRARQFEAEEELARLGYEPANAYTLVDQQGNSVSMSQLPYTAAGAWRRYRELDAEMQELLHRRSPVPDAPFKGTQEWAGLAMKRVIDEAVAGDYDRVAWARGEQIQAIVGGVEEGQSEFYDEILPRWVQKYIKKTGGKLEQVEIPTGEAAGAASRYRYAGPDLTDEVLERAANRARTQNAADLLEDLRADVEGVQQRSHVLTSRLGEVEEDVRDEVLRLLRGRMEEMAEGAGGGATNPSFRVTPVMRESVRTKGQVLYTFPGPVLDAFKTTAGQAAAAAGLGAALDQDHPLRGALAGAGAVLSIKAGMVGKTVARLAAAERRGTLREILRPLADDELGALAGRIRRWNAPLAAQVAGEVEERAARLRLDPGQVADRDIELLARGPLKPLRETPGRALSAPEREAIVNAYQQGDRELRHRIVDELEQAMDEASPAQAEHYERLIDSLEAEGYAPALPERGDPGIDPSRHVNLGTFALDPMGERRLADHVRRVVEAEGLDPKTPVTWDQVRDAAREIGLNPNDVTFVGKKGAGRLSGAEMLAIRNQIRENVEGIETISRNLAMFGETMPDAEREMLERVVAEAEAQNSALLSRFVQGRTQAGRDLNALKILANQTLDPMVWEARAAKLLRAAGKPFTEEHRAVIRSILAECS